MKLQKKLNSMHTWKNSLFVIVTRWIIRNGLKTLEHNVTATEIYSQI